MGKTKPAPETAEPAPGEDNNKHLAFLQAQEESAKAAIGALGIVPAQELSPLEAVISLVVDQAASIETLTKYLAEAKALPTLDAEVVQKIDALGHALEAAGITLQEGQNAIDQSIVLIGHWREGNLELAEAIIAGEHELKVNETPLQAAVRILSVASEATAGELAAIQRADELEKELSIATAKVASLQNAIESLEDVKERPGFLNRLFRGGHGGGGAGEAGDEPAIVRDPIECGPTFGTASVEEIRGFLAEDHHIEIVLSDGENELIQFPPHVVQPGDIQKRGVAYHLVKPLLVVGPEGGQVEIAGAAFVVDGVQADYCACDRPLRLEPGAQYQLGNQFTFGS